jgi:hypothetical protein
MIRFRITIANADNSRGELRVRARLEFAPQTERATLVRHIGANIDP